MKKIMLIGSIFVILIAIPITIYLVSQQQDIRKKASPATTLSLTPSSTTKKVGDDFSLEVTIDPGDNQVVATELHLTFDPDKLEAKTITNGALFPNVLASGLVAPGTASITVGAPSSTKPVKKSGSVAVIRFKALATTTVPISIRFASTTFVGGLGEKATNILVGTNPANVTIVDDAKKNTPLVPTLSPTSLSSTSSATISTGSATLKIVSQASNTSTASGQPTFKGTAPPGSTITITIYSTPVTVIVTADAKGNWIYTPASPLEPGPHNIVVVAHASGSGTLTTSDTFVVATGSGAPSQSVTPVSGTVELTIGMIILAFLLIGTGIAIPVIAKRNPYD